MLFDDASSTIAATFGPNGPNKAAILVLEYFPFWFARNGPLDLSKLIKDFRICFDGSMNRATDGTIVKSCKDVFIAKTLGHSDLTWMDWLPLMSLAMGAW
jgi:hypothetical protein